MKGFISKNKYFILLLGFTLMLPLGNVYAMEKVSCGSITNIPKKLTELTSWAVTLIQIAVPVILVVMGSLDMIKGVTAQKEDEIKKGQQLLIKRLIAAAIIFFVIVIVKFLISVVGNTKNKDSNGKTEVQNITECMDCFLNGKCS